MTATQQAAPAPQQSLTLYMVAWTGGLEEPSFQSFATREAAEETLQSWSAESGATGDRVSLIEQSVAADGTITTVIADEFSADTGEDEGEDEGEDDQQG